MFDIEEWLPFLVAKSHQAAFTMMRDALEKHGLTPPQFATLAFLWKSDGINQQELGALVNIDRTTIGGILDRLERLELVRRGMDRRDRRSYVLYVTDRGKSIQKQILGSLEQVRETISSALTPAERDELVRLLKKLRTAAAAAENKFGRL